MASRANTTIFNDAQARRDAHQFDGDRERQKDGLEVVTYDDLKVFEIWMEFKDDRDLALIKTWERYFERFGIAAGRVGVYGFGGLGASWETLKLLSQHFPALEFVGERQQTLFDVAIAARTPTNRFFKDVGQRTNLVMQSTWDFIAGHRAKGDAVVKADRNPLTIGDIKRFMRVNCWNRPGKPGRHDLHPGARRRLSAQFRHGQRAAPAGPAIVFDLFPRDIQSKYFHDMTRT